MSTTIEFEQTKAGFQEMLDLIGIPFMGKRCISGPIEVKRCQEMVGMLPEYATKVDMLAEDFDDLGIIANQSSVVLEDINFTVLSIERDSMDPCVHFLVVADH